MRGRVRARSENKKKKKKKRKENRSVRTTAAAQCGNGTCRRRRCVPVTVAYASPLMPRSRVHALVHTENLNAAAIKKKKNVFFNISY